MKTPDHLKKHLSKFNQLCQQTRNGHSNNLGGCSKNNHTCTSALTTAITTPAEPTTATTMQLDKWVKNLQEVPLTKVQVSLLAHGPTSN